MIWKRSLLLVAAALTASCDEPTTSGKGSSGAPTRTISFKEEIVPLIAKNCALAACHSSKESPQSFFVTYEPEQIYAELMKPSPTCQSWDFVVPGKPEQSMVMVKMDGEQSSLPQECASARRSEMPPGDPPGSDSELLPLAERDVLRAWIEQGAKNDL